MFYFWVVLLRCWIAVLILVTQGLRLLVHDESHWTPAFAGVTSFVVISFPIDLIAFLLDLMPYLFDTMAYKLSSRRKPGSSVVRTIVINA